MQLTRVLRSSALTSKSINLPERSYFGLLASAYEGVMSLFASADARVQFSKYVDAHVINDRVLARADWGAVRLLSLFHEVQNPVWKQQALDWQEFLTDVAPALENFHNVLGELQNELHHIPEKEEESAPGEDAPPLSDKDEDLRKEYSDFMSRLSFTGNTGEDGPKVPSLWRYSWGKRADQDPESKEAELALMCSDQCFNRLEVGSKAGFILNKYSMFEEGSSQVNNVAILSARVMEWQRQLEQDKMESKKESTDSEEKTKDDKNEEEETKEEENLKMAAQVEVLYDIQQTFHTIQPAKAERAGEEKELSIVQAMADKTSEKGTKQMVVVAVFEAWLETEQGLQWRLANSRPPLEFPFHFPVGA